MKKFIIHNSLSRSVKLCLLIILVLATLLRVWRLDINPPGLTPDEASLGYNAYSILKTGKDEYGKFLPIIFKSFGDYKPGLYVYLTIPFVAVFGLNEWSVRLPSAIAGVITVYLVYLMVKEFGYILHVTSSGNKLLTTNYQLLATITSSLLAVSPWHIQFSRGAWEINVALTLTLVGIYFFLKSLKTPKSLILSALFFSLTLIAYQGAKLSTAIVLVCLVLVFYKEVIKWIRLEGLNIVKPLLVFVVITLPVLLSLFRGQTGRLQVFSIFSYQRPKEYLDAILKQNNEKIGDVNYILFHNNFIFYKNGILARYFNHFSARFLFFEGDYQNPRHSAPNSGMLQLFDIFLLTIGLICLVRFNNKISKFVLLWLVLSPLPAVLTRDQVQAVRAYNMVIPLTLISTFGVIGIIKLLNYLTIKSRVMAYSFFSFFVFMFLCSFIYFLDSYFVHLPVHNAKYWFYGYKQTVLEVSKIQNNYQKVLFQQSYDQPYIYFLFYQKYDPKKYQLQANLTSGGLDVGLVEKLDNINFVSFSWPYATGQKNTLVAGNSVAIPSDFNTKDYNLIREIKYPDKFMTAFRILEVK